MPVSTRIERVRECLAGQGLPALLVTGPDNIYYLAGFSGSAGALLITDTRRFLVSDFRYVQQAAEETPEWEFILAEGPIEASLASLFTDLQLAEVGFEAGHVTCAAYQALAGEQRPYALRATGDIVERVRIVKDSDEIARIREAVRITDEAYAHLTGLVRPGVTERELALEAEWFMRRHGAEAVAFPIIVAAGAHGALPHAQPGDRAVQPGDLVVVDMGARFAHYCADMTRTFAVAEATPIARDIYRICAEAQRAGVEGISAGISGREADRIVRDVIVAAGYGEQFGHGTGHGVGVEIHEAPRLSRLGEGTLPTGAVVTVEPGIYLPGVGGVRIEDLVIVREQGIEILTAAPKPMELPVFG